ncbi:hypothetical protein HDV05_003181, partial [Chytridiales sp. JEL 0842]
MAEKFSPEQFTVPAAFPEILKDLNREVLRHQPKDIYQFCANYFQRKLADQRGTLISIDVSTVSAGGDVNMPADTKEVTPAVTTDITSSQPLSTTETEKPAKDPHDSDSDSNASDSDEESDSLPSSAPPPPPSSHNRGRRTSVSAESMAPTTDKDYVKVVVPKSEDQKARIHASIKNNFLFRSCDEEQYTDV